MIINQLPSKSSPRSDFDTFLDLLFNGLRVPNSVFVSLLRKELGI
ncbi:MAG: hypothetical protein ACFFCS_14090 [Candidatus Hodarchaeota archaeon]